jgi:Protein of unknown function (DUF2905)
MDLVSVGKHLLLLGVLVCLVGVVLIALGKGLVPRLPGDFAFRWGNVRVFLPLASSIILSIVLTIVLNLIARR